MALLKRDSYCHSSRKRFNILVNGGHFCFVWLVFYIHFCNCFDQTFLDHHYSSSSSSSLTLSLSTLSPPLSPLKISKSSSSGGWITSVSALCSSFAHLLKDRDCDAQLVRRSSGYTSLILSKDVITYALFRFINFLRSMCGVDNVPCLNQHASSCKYSVEILFNLFINCSRSAARSLR